MDSTFSPEFMPDVTSLPGSSILTELPAHYLGKPSAANYVALGVVYTIMGMGVPEGVDSASYLDKTMMGVFTLLNDKAEEMGLPAFEPPTPLSNDATAKIAAFLDNYLSKTADSELA